MACCCLFSIVFSVFWSENRAEVPPGAGHCSPELSGTLGVSAVKIHQWPPSARLKSSKQHSQLSSLSLFYFYFLILWWKTKPINCCFIHIPLLLTWSFIKWVEYKRNLVLRHHWASFSLGGWRGEQHTDIRSLSKKKIESQTIVSEFPEIEHFFHHNNKIHWQQLLLNILIKMLCLFPEKLIHFLLNIKKK